KDRIVPQRRQRRSLDGPVTVKGEVVGAQRVHADQDDRRLREGLPRPGGGGPPAAGRHGGREERRREEPEVSEDHDRRLLQAFPKDGSRGPNPSSLPLSIGKGSRTARPS